VTHPSRYLMSPGFSPGIAGHSSPHRNEVTRAWRFTFTPTIHLHGLCLSTGETLLYIAKKIIIIIIIMCKCELYMKLFQSFLKSLFIRSRINLTVM
jgi:hypothetical protein